MATATLKGKPVRTNGKLPVIGTKAPDLRLPASGFGGKGSAGFAGRKS